MHRPTQERPRRAALKRDTIIAARKGRNKIKIIAGRNRIDFQLIAGRREETRLRACLSCLSFLRGGGFARCWLLFFSSCARALPLFTSAAVAVAARCGPRDDVVAVVAARKSGWDGRRGDIRPPVRLSVFLFVFWSERCVDVIPCHVFPSPFLFWVIHGAQRVLLLTSSYA